MAIYTDIRPLIVQQFNSINGTDLGFDDLKIVDISENNVPDMLKYNTLITISGGGKEDESVFYNRAGIDTVVIGKQEMLMPNKNNTSIHALLPTINKLFGLELSTSEVADAPVKMANGDIDITITNSLNFIKGSKFTITVTVGMLVNSVPHHVYTMTDGVKRPDIYQLPCSNPGYTNMGYGTATTFAGLLTANVDYTPIAYILRNVGSSEQYYGDDRLHMKPRDVLGHAVAAIRAVDGLPWTNTSGDYNTYAWYPVYNGPTKACKGLGARHMQIGEWIDSPEALAAIDLVNTEYDNVLLFRSTPSGSNLGFKITHMVCHYNGVL